MTITFDETVVGMQLTIKDDGVGFKPLSENVSSWGLTTMRERALAIGGKIDIISEPGMGTKIIVTIMKKQVQY